MLAMLYFIFKNFEEFYEEGIFTTNLWMHNYALALMNDKVNSKLHTYYIFNIVVIYNNKKCGQS